MEEEQTTQLLNEKGQKIKQRALCPLRIAKAYA
jgi:hypothetical protein